MSVAGRFRGPDDDPIPIGEPGDDEDFEDDEDDGDDEDDEDGDYEQEESPARSRNV